MYTDEELRNAHPNLMDGATADEQFGEEHANRQGSKFHRVQAMRMRALGVDEEEIIKHFGYKPEELVPVVKPRI